MNETVVIEPKIETKLPNVLKKIERDEFGLVKGYNYIFDEGGKVNWRKLIKPEYLVPMRGVEETDITKLQDKDLMILLQGTKELADLRGYKSVTYKIINASPEYCCASCNIKWIGNYESEGREIEFESIGDASLNSTDSFARLYMGAIAENRAFVRCVRNFLRINIVGKDEIGNSNIIKSTDNKSVIAKQAKLLEDIMEKKNIIFNPHIIAKLKEEGKWDESYKSVKDLPPEIILHYIGRLKKYDPQVKTV